MVTSGRDISTSRRNSSHEQPDLIDTDCDVRIPISAWSPIKCNGEPRKLRRKLTTVERAKLEQRRDDLNRAMRPIGDDDRDYISAVIATMMASFNIQSEDERRVLAMLSVVSDMPRFAIEQACMRIMRGEADGIDKRWPPSSAILRDVAASIVAAYRKRIDDIDALLSADVEEQDQPRAPQQQSHGEQQQSKQNTSQDEFVAMCKAHGVDPASIPNAPPRKQASAFAKMRHGADPSASAC
jgi:hypothetical protein